MSFCTINSVEALQIARKYVEEEGLPLYGENSPLCLDSAKSVFSTMIDVGNCNVETDYVLDEKGEKVFRELENISFKYGSMSIGMFLDIWESMNRLLFPELVQGIA